MSTRNFDRVNQIEALAWAFLAYWDGLDPSERRGEPVLDALAEQTRHVLKLPKHAAKYRTTSP